MDHQINAIATLADGSPVVLVEDGAFTGFTVEYLLTLLKNKGIHVAAVVIGICFPGAMDNIRKDFAGEIIVVEETKCPYEWMPDHDFIPFAPNCGRVFGGKFGDSLLPYYNHDGYSYCFPYILPFGDPVKWASLPPEVSWKFSLFCLHSSVALFEKLDELNGRKITMEDLNGATPRISVPMSLGSSHLPDAECPVSEFLSEACNEIA